MRLLGSLMAVEAFVQVRFDHKISMFVAIIATFPYWVSAISKTLDFSATAQEMAQFGLHPPALFASLVLLLQASGSAMLISGFLAWLGALLLGTFTAAATLQVHAFWQHDDQALRFAERAIFFEHIGLIGGLIACALLWAKWT